MAIIVNGSATFNTGNGITSLNIDFPQDVITPAVASSLDYAYLAVLVIDSSETISTPSGWTLEDNAPFNATYNHNLYIFSKTYDASFFSQSFVASGPARITGAMMLLGGVSISSPVVITVTNGLQSTGITHNTGSVTPTLADSMLVGIWTGPDTPVIFSPPGDMTTRVAVQASTPLAQIALTIATVINAGTSSVSKTGTGKNATTGADYSTNCLAALLVINPSQLPTKPTLTYPVGGESITIGTTQTLTCNAASSPVVAASSLQYEFSYSLNGGITWNALSLSSAGVPSKAWSTSGLSATSNAKVRVRAYDGTNFGPYDTLSGTFSLVTETAPAKPTGLSPDGGVGRNRANAIVLSWTHQGGVGNPQTAYSGEWSLNADMSSPTAFSASSSTQSHTISGGTWTVDQTIYWRVKTTGLTLQSAFSDIASFVAAAVPATPNITSPTAGSPPTSATHVVTFTEASAFTARRYSIEIASVEIFTTTPEWVSSTSLSFTSPYNFQDGVAVDVKLKVRNQYGLESNTDTESVTPSYVAPDAPTLTVTALPDEGCIQVTVANTGSLDYNQLRRWVTSEGQGSAKLISVQMAVNGTFRDFNVRSGVEYSYEATAVSSTGETPSSEETATLNLTSAWIHLLTRDSTTSNSLSAVSLRNEAPDRFDPAISLALQQARGRSRSLALVGPHRAQSLSVRVFVNTTAERQALEALQSKVTDVCLRTHNGFIVMGKMQRIGFGRDFTYQKVDVSVTESDYEEDLS